LFLFFTCIFVEDHPNDGGETKGSGILGCANFVKTRTTQSTFSDCDCSCGMHALLTSDLQERREPKDTYVPSVARSSSCPNSNTAPLSKEAKDLKGPYLLVPGTT